MPRKTPSNRLRTSSPNSAQMTSAGAGLPVRWKVAISAALVFHLLAVVAEPLQFFSRSARGVSEAFSPLRWSVGPYAEFAYLNHGYFFFAPVPGPSHLLQCTLEYPDSDPVKLRFPDRTAQWPRLLYHRHFMLAEFLQQLHVPPPDPLATGGDLQALKAWQLQRVQFEMIRDSMSRHLLARYEASDVKIDRLEHRLPDSTEVLQQGLKLDDPALYLLLPDAPPESRLDALPGPVGAIPSGLLPAGPALSRPPLQPPLGRALPPLPPLSPPVSPQDGKQLGGEPVSGEEVRP